MQQDYDNYACKPDQGWSQNFHEPKNVGLKNILETFYVLLCKSPPAP
jgi:hypothetical protein